MLRVELSSDSGVNPMHRETPAFISPDFEGSLKNA